MLLLEVFLAPAFLVAFFFVDDLPAAAFLWGLTAGLAAGEAEASLLGVLLVVALFLMDFEAFDFPDDLLPALFTFFDCTPTLAIKV